MAKLRRRKRRLSFEGISLFFLVVCTFMYLAFSLFVNTQNAQLSMEIQNLNQDVALLKNENRDLNINIQTLQNKERIYVVAQSAGLNSNQDNIIALNSGE